jgi:hypothetical protein
MRTRAVKENCGQLKFLLNCELNIRYIPLLNHEPIIFLNFKNTFEKERNFHYWLRCVNLLSECIFPSFFVFRIFLVTWTCSDVEQKLVESTLSYIPNSTSSCICHVSLYIKKVKLTLYQAMEVHRFVRRRGSQIF